MCTKMCEKKFESESVYRERTSKAMANRKRTNGQTLIYKTIHRKLKFEQ